MGRKKITIRRIESEAARSVCFSKRRAGLFKKASELAVLCGAEVAAVAFSPGGKAFSFGHPSVKAVHDRFLAGGGAGGQGAADANDLKELTGQHDRLRTKLEELKARKLRVDEAMAKDRAMGDPIAAWLDPNLGDMGEEDKKAFAAALKEVQTAVSARSNQVLLETLASLPPPPQLFGGSTFDFGSSSGNAGMETMVMPPPSGFFAWTDMQQMMMEMTPQMEFTAGMEMQQMLVAMPQPPLGSPSGTEMQQTLMETSQQQAGFPAGTEMQQMLMDIPQQPEFAAGMEMVQVQQGLGPNASFPF